MVQAVLDTGGVQYELTPISPSDGGNPLRDGIRTTFVLSQEAKDAITAYAASVRNMTFDKFVETMMAKLVGRMLADGFFQCDYRMKATMLSRLLPDSTAERRTVLDHLSPEIQQQLADDMKFRVEPTDRGTLMVHWDMHESTEAYITKLAEGTGSTFDALMGELNQPILEQVLQAEQARARRN